MSSQVDNNDASAQRQQRATELRRIVQAPSEKELAARELAEIERQEAAEREEAGRVAAADRIKAISRAAGSVIAQLDDDERKVEDAAKAYAAAVAQLNARYRQVEMLKAESDALVDRFGIGAAKVPQVLPPNRRERSIAAARQVQAAEPSDYRAVLPITEQCSPHRLRVRRNYSEVAGSEAHEIIIKAALRPFPALNEAQQRIIEERQREQEEATRSMKAIAPLAQETNAALSLVPGGVR